TLVIILAVFTISTFILFASATTNADAVKIVETSLENLPETGELWEMAAQNPKSTSEVENSDTTIIKGPVFAPVQYKSTDLHYKAHIVYPYKYWLRKTFVGY
ncbi:3622_t:CDS:1, partial [Acaulospora morrowiae]